MSLRKEQCNKVCRILDDVLANRPNERDSLVIATRKAFAGSHWIPVTERLPEESGLYIVTNAGRWIEPVGTRYYNIRADGGFWSGHPGDKVLAWMPLPEPYREDGA